MKEYELIQHQRLFSAKQRTRLFLFRATLLRRSIRLLQTKIGTWNVLTLTQQGKLAQLANETCRMKLEIPGLSEIRWPNFAEHRLASGQILIYPGLRGEHAPRYRGVGFLLSAHTHGHINILMNDFNANVGSDNSDYEHAMGSHCLG